MANPFKFGTIVGEEFFTDRTREAKDIKHVLASNNHLILISPRRYGKTSLALKVVKMLKRPVIYLDLQITTDAADMATQIMKRVLKISKWEKVKNAVSGFRIMPTLELNPLNGGINVTFTPSASDSFVPLEDVMNLIEHIGEKGKRPIVILDEFQEIEALGKNLPKKFRSVIQSHSHVNYVFLGSAESMMRQIFETKKSPFYHFGHLMTMGKIPHEDFLGYLETRLGRVTDKAADLSAQILAFTDCHPYYTQQLAFYCYTYLEENGYQDGLMDSVISAVLSIHNNDFEKLWNTMRSTDKKIMIALAEGWGVSSVAIPSSTAYSGLGRLAAQGYVVKNENYELDDPFFARWIVAKRNA
ncbi:MAG: ATP-binding protein [Clostridiales Family XIII bacterium]|nr:ATP-binding protein [Clostridiales Family XIII bacterium]